MKATINDVAKHAGVSIKTVSRVINNEQTVRKATEQKVREAVKILNYRPNNSARSLAGSKSYSIGFIYDNPNAYHVIDMQKGILSECKNNHFELLIHPCEHQSVNLKEELSHLFQYSRMAGIVLAPPFTEMPEIISLLKNIQLPFVKIISGTDEYNEPYSIYINDYKAAYNITENLIQQGHKNIGFISGGKDDQSSIERLRGFQQALDDHNIKLQKQNIVEGAYSFDSGVSCAEQLLQHKNRPTAIFASNDEIAAGALYSAQLLRIPVPGQLSIAGFEDSPFSRQTIPKLTTAHQPNELIAMQASNLLIARIQGWSQKQIEEKGIITHFCPELVIRDSTSIMQL